jgi:hypothetical protein
MISENDGASLCRRFENVGPVLYKMGLSSRVKLSVCHEDVAVRGGKAPEALSRYWIGVGVKGYRPLVRFLARLRDFSLF